MKSRTWLLAAAMALAFAPLAHAQYTNYQGPVVNASGQTVQGSVPVSAANPLPVTVASQTGANATQVQGSAAAGSAFGNPVMMGFSADGTNVQAARGVSNGALGDGTSQSNALSVESFPLEFNGATYDRDFTCKNSAVVNVTAGNTTQIVGLSGTTVIRVCSIALSMSAAGTAGVYTGTGTNCGTGTTAIIQDMTLATGTPLQLSAANGSLVRSSAGGEVCVKAVTGNVTGFISYAQY